ncbi:hypothetical protein FIM10_06385 [Sphingomonadales bacterium 56]|jgi:hypothetical protein|uniref:hypothetical protein n=1 Tax=unclassified Sphingobium TaxID=2611147 RepID=UPI00191933E2|nr:MULTISPECIES: hypothetical protein [unclassified Sphingobium]MBY2928301.1 hypothetical protein [Sphingomonadales bacterium 56]MBY2958401.1 hypothetical protein [Sphingomonadales bacterium 58]CAD7336978.1 hypothetical protein SPHS6_01290 [Sphingobium sp. S6]CAD7337035.1 hypothetical protein SPHS8_01327 [Sphingobium sp. S8]
MNEYASRSDLTQVDRVSSRTPSAVPAVQPVAAQQGMDTPAGKPQDGGTNMGLSEDDLASAAEYAKVHARVADILAELRSASATPTVEGAEAEIQTLLPAPMILVPLPPASKEAVESAVTLGKRIAEQASYAHAAQAHLKRGTVDQLLSTDH